MHSFLFFPDPSGRNRSGRRTKDTTRTTLPSAHQITSPVSRRCRRTTLLGNHQTKTKQTLQLQPSKCLRHPLDLTGVCSLPQLPRFTSTSGFSRLLRGPPSQAEPRQQLAVAHQRELRDAGSGFHGPALPESRGRAERGSV